ncbi:L-threonylcarbamoyladenylate synthase [Algoriphagus boritolerans]|uniref:Threonylcarbamoyl-AMP synthase n=1 Tax=Algoriphagus boritolerans DSM 17298 = JCM 18970 TaxID=1120964 RepID=A0A1H6A0P7_9BACT|nr:L-threonylcarbamoyladenylate synthase [Algoriphagus boritolerans]SEG41814.1 L-threonylcarbamoyladenylate synthase [Algoriphagus boritolerans DSM 17298 = JCM 18970]
MAEIGKDIEKAKLLLQEGKLVAIPTETVYGLAGNALDAEAVAMIFETKNRPAFDPLILHTSSIERVEDFVSSFPEKLKVLAENFWPGPLTLLLPRKPIVPDLVTSGLDRVAIRVPNHPLTLALLESLDFPLAAPSANPFGYISPTAPVHVAAQLGEKIPYILDGGACEVGLESTIVGIEEDEIVIYRLGGLDISEIEKLVGPVKIKDHSSSNPAAPGQLDSHYAPRKPFVLGELKELVSESLTKNVDFSVLSFSDFFPEISAESQIALSPEGNLLEAAKNLFSAMRKLDEGKSTVILAELLPEEGLGRAINDRLRRAAVK